MKKLNRRYFIKQNTIAGVGLALSTRSFNMPHFLKANESLNKPAILGGKKLVDVKWPRWPEWIPATDEPRVLEVLRSGVWSRKLVVTEFEEKWAKEINVKACVTTVNGTNALYTAIVQSNIGPGDEVIVPVYTYIATIQAVLQAGAMPIFVDTNPATFMMDEDKIEQKITKYTKAIIPVHIAGMPADMDKILAIANKHKLVVIEDACQAHLSEYKGKKAGTIGDAGCFSFQNSKTLPIGEGGAIVSNDKVFIEKCFAYHNLGLPLYEKPGTVSAGAEIKASKFRLTEYQAAIGLAQLTRLKGTTDLRNKNAMYLHNQMQFLKGATPFKLHEGVSRCSFLFFPFRYNKEEFKGLSREKFINALNAEGVPVYSGYATLNNQPYLENAFSTTLFKRFFPAKKLDIKNYNAFNHCPENDKLCNEDSVWINEKVLRTSFKELDMIIMAIEKVKSNAEKL